VSFTCLSQDAVVHEASHALLDGLRNRFMAPSSPDQAAFHEGFGDIVALLSVFSLGKVLRTLLERDVARERDAARDGKGKKQKQEQPQGLIPKASVTRERLMGSVLLGLAEEMGEESESPRARALRRSVDIGPDEHILDRLEYGEPRRRGEILVAAMMRTFVDVWTRRLESLGTIDGKYLDLGRVAEEGATIAEVLLTMAIRAIDYTPPIHIEFGDYLSALVTADSEIRADDSRYGLRGSLLEWFGSYGIKPASGTEDGTWVPPSHPLEPDGQEVTLEGGSTLVLDEYGRLKYEIHNWLLCKGKGEDNSEAQRRLQYLWDQGAFDAGRSFNARIATMHRRRSGLAELDARSEVW
jgi:hypothetical protein